MLLIVLSLLSVAVYHSSMYAYSNRESTNSSILGKSESIITVHEKYDTVIFAIKPNSILFLNKDIDLKGKVYILPKGVTIKQGKGLIKNGTLIGNKTKIESGGAIFDKVSIRGSWNVPTISTDLFKDMNYVNSLQDLIALSDNNVHNNIYIKTGNYNLSVEKENQSCLMLKSNSNLNIDGNLCLVPNRFKHYNIICVTGNNIHISGKGSIIGDKDKHTGTEGEWGMGVRFSKAYHCTLIGLNIKDCWGDCIYIGGKSSDVKIKECTLRNGRRQGISVTSGRNISIEKCNIYDIAGTNPMFAIDVEPNKTNVVDSVFIKNVKTYNCKGGIMCTRSTRSDSSIGYVEIIDCTVRGTTEKNSFKFKGANIICVKRCKGEGKQISFENVRNVIIEKNTVVGLKQNHIYTFYKCRNIRKK